jgi:hypothetical protein
MVRIVAALAVLFALAATPAAAAPHQAGYWYVETAGSDASSCGAYAKVDDTLSFGFLAIRGAVSFSLTGKGVRRGKRGTFEPDGETFQFEPEFDGRDHLYLDDYLSEEALAAVRSASRLRVTVDDKRVAEMVIKDTGVPEVLDAVIACSKGEAGWWGKGAVEPPPDPNAPRFNKEGFWSLASDGPLCVAMVVSEHEEVALQLLSSAGDVYFSVGSPAAARRGRSGSFEIDGYSFAFKPRYSGKDYFMGEDSLDSDAVYRLRGTKTARVSVDGRVQLDLTLDGTGLPQLLTDLLACSHGQSGWWGEGAKPRG